MTGLLGWIVAFTALGGILSALMAGLFLLFSERRRTRLLPTLVSFAIGALLGAAFLGILPHAIEAAGEGGVTSVTFTVLLGVLAFFILEKMVIWRHCHTHDCEVHGHHPAEKKSRPDYAHIDFDEVRRVAAGKLILIGDGIHNLVDGVLIAAAFITDIQLGVVTSIAVIAHEIPQELGDFAILLHSGYPRGRALLYNVLTGLTTVVGGVIAFFSLSSAQGAVPYVLAIAAASFLYIAVADLIPGLHRRPEVSATLHQATLIALGVSVIFLAQRWLD